MKPGTELPWEVGDYDQWDKLIPLIGHTQYYGHGPFAAVDNDDVAEGEGARNAAYIVHACNAYPKLVEALKDIRQFWDDGGLHPIPLSPHALISVDPDLTARQLVEKLLAECEED